MTEHEFSILLMMCGALNDISENTKEDCTRRQISEVQKRIERLVTDSDLFATLIDTKNFNNQ